MQIENKDLISKEVRRYLRDVADHQTEAADQIAAYDDMLNSLVQAALARVGHAAEHGHAQDLGLGRYRRGAHHGRRHLRHELPFHARAGLDSGATRRWSASWSSSACSSTSISEGGAGSRLRLCTARRFGSSTSTPSFSHACRMASAPLSRTHAASVAVIGVARQELHRVARRIQRQVGNVAAAQQHRGERGPPDGLAHSGEPRSISASGTSTTPSTAGVAASIARLRASPVAGPGSRRRSTTSARGPRKLVGDHLSRIGHRVARAAQRHVMHQPVRRRKRSTSMGSAPRKVTLAESGSTSKWPRRCARTRSRICVTRRAAR